MRVKYEVPFFRGYRRDTCSYTHNFLSLNWTRKIENSDTDREMYSKRLFYARSIGSTIFQLVSA
jgi:hypothetical protein